MKSILFALLLLPMLISGQDITTNLSQLNFGTVNTGDKDSLLVQVNNRTQQTVNINAIKFYSIYNDFPFSTSQQSFVLPGNSSHSFWVRFHPSQNILHNSEMVIQHNENTGMVAVDLIGQGHFPNSYYNSTENLSEEALKLALRTRLGQNYTSYSYNVARDNMYGSIDNKNGSVECVYTGRTANFNTRAGATSNNFNCEHTFPQGFFSQNLPMRSDIHHLFSTDETANNQRGNLPFGIVNGSGSWSQGGSKKSGSTFEPRDLQKGKTARAMMYFVIRYQDYSNHFSSQETILRTWHNAFPVDLTEEQRNNAIFALQNNRNPFIDYPQLEKRITNFVSNSTAPVQYGLDILQSQINFGTRPIFQADTFNYILVNSGNQVINFSNFSLSNTTAFSFAGNSGSNRSLSPGESIAISIIFTATSPTSFTGSLDFNTSIPGGLSNLSIPITANGTSVSVIELNSEEQIQVFPIPFAEELIIQHNFKSKSQILLRDVSGRIVHESYAKKGQSKIVLSTEKLSAGFYSLQIQVEGKQHTQQVLKR